MGRGRRLRGQTGRKATDPLLSIPSDYLTIPVWGWLGAGLYRGWKGADNIGKRKFSAGQL